MIQVKNLRKIHPNGQGIYDVSFTLEKNKIYGLLGNNGAGKSTLLNVITGYYKPSNNCATKKRVPNGQGKKVAQQLKKYNLIYLTLSVQLNSLYILAPERSFVFLV